MNQLLGAALVVCALGVAAPAHAQYRNMGIGPSVGWLSLGLWDRALHGGRVAGQSPPEPGWNLTEQPTLGVNYFFAIGYQLWVDSEAQLGAWTTIIDDPVVPVMTFAASIGIHYNFMEERVRPFVGAHIQYLQLISFEAAPIPTNEFLGKTPLFVGLRPNGGVEWVFGDEQSVTFEAGLIGLLVPDRERGLGNLFLPSSEVRLSYNIYF